MSFNNEEIVDLIKSGIDVNDNLVLIFEQNNNREDLRDIKSQPGREPPLGCSFCGAIWG